MNEYFCQGFVKAAEAKEKPDGHHVRRLLLGNPISSAIEAKKGKKTKAFGQAYGHGVVEGLKGLGKGALVGAGVGGLAGAGAAIAKKDPKMILKGLGVGSLIGAYGGGVAGGIKGNHGAEASRIHAEHSKHKK